MTKGLTKRIIALEKQVKLLIESDKKNIIMIGRILKHSRQVEEKFLHFDVVNVVLSDILIKNKLTTRKKILKLCNNEAKKLQKQREKQIQEKLKKVENSKKTLKKEMGKKEKKVN